MTHVLNELYDYVKLGIISNFLICILIFYALYFVLRKGVMLDGSMCYVFNDSAVAAVNDSFQIQNTFSFMLHFACSLSIFTVAYVYLLVNKVGHNYSQNLSVEFTLNHRKIKLKINKCTAAQTGKYKAVNMRILHMNVKYIQHGYG